MFGLILFLTNCSVQKRVHLKGWNIEWKTNVKESVANKIIKSKTIEGEIPSLKIDSDISFIYPKNTDSVSVGDDHSTDLKPISVKKNKFLQTFEKHPTQSEDETQAENKTTEKRHLKTLKKSYFGPLIILVLGLVVLLFTLIFFFGPSTIASSSLLGTLLLFLSFLLILLGILAFLKVLFSSDNNTRSQLKKNHSSWTYSIHNQRYLNNYISNQQNFNAINPPNSRVSLPLIFIDIMLLLLGALLLVACLLAAPEALAAGLASGGIFGMIGIVFGIILGAFLFVLGLVLLIVHLSKRQQQKKKVEEVIEEEKRKEAGIETKSSEPEGNSETAPEEIKTTKSSSDALWIIGIAAALVALFFIVK